MDQDIHEYNSEDITVSYDSKRCIHAAECVKNLRSVFDPDKKPWIQPENASAEKIKKAVHHCPTGALKYSNDSEERPARTNSITIGPDGPLYLRGDIEIKNTDGETILEDTRVALCRCGASENKPFCDNSHENIEFEAPAGFDESKLRPTDNDNSDDGKLILRLMENGPILVEGKYEVYSIANQRASSKKNVAFCRCGQSSTKPFCDGTHKDVGFEG